MLRVDVKYHLSVGFIHEKSFYPISNWEVGDCRPTIEAKQNSICLHLEDVTYTFSRRFLTRLYWCSSTDRITIEWNYNTGPKIHCKGQRTVDNPLKLDSIECNALAFYIEPTKSATKEGFKKIFAFKDKNLPCVPLAQHESKIPESLPRIVGLYLETLISMVIPRGRITPNFWKILTAATEDEAISALMLMKKTKKMIINPTEALKCELRNLEKMDPDTWPAQLEKDRENRNDAVLVFQVERTPTKTYVVGPFLEKSNRIIRKYWKYRDHFVRVRFTDEDGRRLDTAEPKIGDFVRDQLKYGITLAGQNYSFLAWSNSQLRAHSCFLFSKIITPQHDVTGRDIIEQLGDFWDDSPAKHGSRIGQCLTSTVGGIRISVNKCEHIRDVVRDGHVFSDGVGTASFGVMELVQKRLGLSEVPSAIQIRYGGAKGVLSLDDRLPDLRIRLRPSMKKFESSHKELEITDHPTYRPAYLNRQMITLLQSLGTKTSALEKLEKNMTSKIDQLLDGVVNEKTLNQITWGHSKDILKEAIETFGLDDGFLRALVNKHSSKALKLLIKKTRILIPNSAYVMGVLDEYGCLEENEVFCQALTDDGEEISFMGEVLVTRSPSVHPGDIRKLKAVWKYELSHLRNVIVFSRKGQRPIPNMISGGDLDGDCYSLIAEQSIFPKRIVPPMDYTASPKPVMKGPKHWPDAFISFYTHYLAKDNLGKVANTWQAQCELQKKGALSPVAIQLAEIHSINVDFPKTGISAALPDKCTTSRYPDYMEKSPKKSFPAPSFIGQSFRRLSAKYGDPFKVADFKLEVDEDLASYPGNNYWLDEAREAYKSYSLEMQTLIFNFGASSDVDIVTGILPQTQGRYRGKKFNAVEKLEVAFKDLKERYLERFKSDTEDHEDKLAKASAWYRAAYESDEEPVFASFAWILAKYLTRVKQACYKRAHKRRYRY